MTEGSSTVKTKRMGARFFKNPPQPHMCIRDSLKGSPDPCYVNVLSWDKVAAGMSSEGVPLYGGMKVCPPRTEKKEVSVFAVMANPGILKLHGKNARNPKERSWLIDILLDFVEKMNQGVVFNRRYTVLRDRDITGELKEIWMVVQSERAKAQQTTGSDELRRPVPQYPYYQDQQQQQQQQQSQLQQQQQMQQQMQQHSMPQHHQHPQQQQHQPQQQLQHAHDEQGQKRIHFDSKKRIQFDSCRRDFSDWFDNWDKNCESREVIIARNAKKYVQYDNNAGRIDHYIFREPIVLQNPQVPQQNCLNYPAYQYQQLPGPMGPPFPPNMHPNASLNCPPPHGANPMNLIRPEPPMHYNKMPIDKFYENFHRMPPPMQPQQPQIPMGPPSGYYEPQNPPPPNFLRMLRPQEPQEIAGRPPSHVPQTKPIIMVDPREALVVPPPQPPNSEEVAAIVESSGPRVPPLQPPHFAPVSNNVMNPPMNPAINHRINSSMNAASSPREQNAKKPSTISIFKLYRPQEIGNTQKDGNHSTETNTNAGGETNDCKNSNDDSSDSRESSGSRNSQQYVKNKFTYNKYGYHERNGANGEAQRNQHFKTKDRTSGKHADVEDRLGKSGAESERNGDDDKERNNSARIASALRILANARRTDETKKKSNGQGKLQSGKDNEEVLQVYTILRKTDATTSQEDVTSNIAQLAIKDCPETTSEVAAVLS